MIFGGSIMIGYKNFDIDPIKILHVYKSFGTWVLLLCV